MRHRASRSEMLVRESQILALSGAGLSRHDIAAKLGISLGLVNLSRHKLRLAGRLPRTRLPHSQKLEVLAQYASGVPVEQVALEFGCAQASIRWWAVQAGIRRPAHVSATDTRTSANERNGARDWAVSAAADGWRVAAIARILGVSHGRVRQWIERDGGESTPAPGPANSAVGPFCPHCKKGITATDLAKTLTVRGDQC